MYYPCLEPEDDEHDYIDYPEEPNITYDPWMDLSESDDEPMPPSLPPLPPLPPPRPLTLPPPRPLRKTQDCFICLEKLNDQRLLYCAYGCGHGVHRECGEHWKKQSAKCPMCRNCLGLHPTSIIKKSVTSWTRKNTMVLISTGVLSKDKRLPCIIGIWWSTSCPKCCVRVSRLTWRTRDPRSYLGGV